MKEALVRAAVFGVAAGVSFGGIYLLSKAWERHKVKQRVQKAKEPSPNHEEKEMPHKNNRPAPVDKETFKETLKAAQEEIKKQEKEKPSQKKDWKDTLGEIKDQIQPE